MQWRTTDIIAATSGELLSGATGSHFSGVGIDSRTIAPSEIFVAIRGDRHDGHRFAESVVDSGCRGVIVAREALADLPLARWATGQITCIAVSDTLSALGALAAWQRRHLAAKVVAITGSNGKTSTRQMATTVMSQNFTTLATHGNYNNEVGLPLTLFGLSAEHRWAVLELGMNHPGEIGRLAAICSPDIGLITNIGPAHLEGVGSIEGVLKAKAEMLPHIRTKGHLILNADDQRLRRLGAECGREVLYYGQDAQAQVRAADIDLSADGIDFKLILPEQELPVHLNTTGAFMVSNALAAAAVGVAAGLSADQIRRGLMQFSPAGGRMRVIPAGGGVNLIDDTYNANLVSMSAAIETLIRLGHNTRKWMVAGDMFELGDHARDMHRQLGKRIAAAQLYRLCATGEFAEEMAAAAIAAGMDAQHILTGSKDEIVSDLKQRLRTGDWVLIKGSRGMRMEEILAVVEKWCQNLPNTQHEAQKGSGR